MRRAGCTRAVVVMGSPRCWGRGAGDAADDELTSAIADQSPTLAKSPSRRWPEPDQSWTMLVLTALSPDELSTLDPPPATIRVLLDGVEHEVVRLGSGYYRRVAGARG